MASLLSDRKPYPMTYGASVDRITAYLEALPQQARSAWVDAAYRIYLSSVLKEPGDAPPAQAKTLT